MKFRAVTVLVLLAAFPPGGYASLGETSAQIESRYAAVIDSRKDDANRVVIKYYLHDGYGISVKFLNGKSQCETYLKEDKSAMSAQEITTLLKANTLGSDWLSIYQSPETGRWEVKYLR